MLMCYFDVKLIIRYTFVLPNTVQLLERLRQRSLESLTGQMDSAL
jgi:hypothetical protein